MIYFLFILILTTSFYQLSILKHTHSYNTDLSSITLHTDCHHSSSELCNCDRCPYTTHAFSFLPAAASQTVFLSSKTAFSSTYYHTILCSSFIHKVKKPPRSIL